jgi:hypothetical protein
MFKATIAKVTETPLKFTSELPPFQENYTNQLTNQQPKWPEEKCHPRIGLLVCLSVVFFPFLSLLQTSATTHMHTCSEEMDVDRGIQASNSHKVFLAG